MNKFQALLLLGLLASHAAQAAEPQAEDYTLSMAGALINDHCSRTWQNAEYVNIHACNFQLANRYTLELAAADFGACTVAAGGDIVRIADCMVGRFNAWLAEQQ